MSSEKLESNLEWVFFSVIITDFQNYLKNLCNQIPFILKKEKVRENSDTLNTLYLIYFTPYICSFSPNTMWVSYQMQVETLMSVPRCCLMICNTSAQQDRSQHPLRRNSKAYKGVKYIKFYSAFFIYKADLYLLIPGKTDGECNRWK